jgi:hypothetical protein
MRIIIKLQHIAVMLLVTVAMAFGTASGKGLSEENGISEETASAEQQQENLARTKVLVEKIEGYLRANDAFVGILSRRGAGDAKTGESDTDTFDLSGMAHTGFVVRNGFGKDAEYITFNLVRQKGAKVVDGTDYDISELRVWTLPHFFVGSFEKDAIVFLPEKKVQLSLWNYLRSNGRLKIEEKKTFLKDDNGEQRLDENGKPRTLTYNVIDNGAFKLLHNPEYNLLSDYVEESTQNCNEHLLKTYIGFRDHWQAAVAGQDIDNMDRDSLTTLKTDINQAVERNFKPRLMVLSRTKSTFAFTQNIRFGESYPESSTLLGLKLSKEKFDVVSVDSFCDPHNQLYLGWNDFKVFRENHTAQGGWVVEDWGKDYVKVNRFTKVKNSIKEL